MEGMRQRLSAPVTVELVSDARTRRVVPKSVWWDGRLYPVLRVGLRHSYRTGRTLYHVFSVASEAVFFRLSLNTETLFWQLEEIADGLPD